MTNFDIPDIMKSLPVDDRGYPIPYFVQYVNGVPDFRYQDTKKKQACRLYNKCSICGKQLTKKSFWFIAGPKGLENRVSSDEAMHEQCARFSLRYCPHLHYEKSTRRDGGITAATTQVLHKPSKVFLVRADQIQFIDGLHTRFRVTKTEAFEYQNNLLTSISNTPNQ